MTEPGGPELPLGGGGGRVRGGDGGRGGLLLHQSRGRAGRSPQQVTQSQPRQHRGNKALSNALHLHNDR